MNTVDTIAAIATCSGGAISVVRISGPQALEVVQSVWRGRGLDIPRRMNLGSVSATGDRALAVFMPGPNSYTGDDVAELQIHGGNLAARRTLEACFAAGARPAEPGEFTFRAFVNGKLDLAQAEAVADFVAASGDAALALAAHQLSGALSRRISGLRTRLVDILGDLESRLDFPEEHLDWATPAELNSSIASVVGEIELLRSTLCAGRRFRDGVAVVICGRPNAGKSSLLNALLGRDRAIVSATPGTTRDTIDEFVTLRNLPVRLTDTAGIRTAEGEIEEEGVERARAALNRADVVLWVIDASEPSPSLPELAGLKSPVIAIWNKCDLPHCALPELPFASVEISTLERTGFDVLLDTFESTVWQGGREAVPEVAVNERHAASLDEAADSLSGTSIEIIGKHWELASVLVRQAVDALGEITGETASVDVLDNIFSRFCIGK
ncbi:MAG: tRNA uridine-5-carboxymethylaminomethyl(34) synthesis GTPase MnmE [Victivallaceae bacterium]|nr:tRNA uridine-5-carboxymethylaminomethyl(34) synthesis GTPase MnmE [Victivallaceae bacterium]